MSTLIAFLLVPFTYFFVLREESLRNCRAQCVVALTFRQCLILTNLYVARLPGYAGDANRFYEDAKRGINWSSLVGTGADFYSNFLAALFSVFGSSRELALESSFIAFGLILLTAGRLIQHLGYQEKAGLAVLMIGFSPSAASYTSSILREGWQGFSLLLAAYGTLKLRREFSARTMIMLVASLFVMGCLQKGLALYALLFAGIAFLYLTQRGEARGPILLIVFILVFFGGYLKLLASGNFEISTSSDVVEAFKEGEIVEYALEYRVGLNEARANYADNLELGSVLGLVTSFPQLILYYWLCPLPWQVEESIDLIALTENWIRTLLLVLGLVGFRKAGREEKTALGFLWTIFLILEIMFAAGTGNWGTAARHRTVGLPLFCVLSISGLVKHRDSFGRLGAGQGTMEQEPPLSKREKIRRRRQRLRELEETSSKSQEKAGKARNRPR